MTEKDFLEGSGIPFSKIKRIPTLGNFGFESLAHFVMRDSHRLSEELLEAQNKNLPSDSIPCHVIVEVGDPTSGKSYISSHHQNWQTNWLKILTDFGELNYSHISWEQAAEMAKKSGWVGSSVDRLNSPKELLSIDRMGQEISALTIKDAHSVTVELPASAARISSFGLNKKEVLNRLPKIKHWVGRPIGSRWMYNLIRGRGLFKEVETDVSVCGLVAGETLIKLTDQYRNEKKQALTYKEFCNVSEKWNRVIPSEQDWEAFSNEGASVEAITEIRRIKRILIALEVHFGVLDLPSDIANQVERLSINSLIDAQIDYHPLRIALEASHLKSFFTHELGFSADREIRQSEKSKRTFIGLNDPTEEEFMRADESLGLK